MGYRTSAIISIALCMASFSGIPSAWGIERLPSVQHGKELFNDPGLGTNGRTCNTCHPDGAKLDQAAGRTDLAGMINGCIVVNLKGKALAVDSSDMQSLIMYIRSLANRTPGAKPSTGC